MNDFVILNANKEIMRLELQTGQAFPGVDGIHTFHPPPAPAKSTHMDLPLDSWQIMYIYILVTLSSDMVTTGWFFMAVGATATRSDFCHFTYIKK